METAGLNAIDDVLFSAPLACFTCGTRFLGKKMLRYLFDVYAAKADPGAVLTELSYVRPCCRRTVMTVPISEQAIQALQELTPDEPGFKALMASVFARPDATPKLPPVRVASRGRKAEPVTSMVSAPTQFPYNNVYITPKKGTSELVKGFRIYGPEDLEQVRKYELERDLKTRTGIVTYKEYRNPTEAQLLDDELIAKNIATLTSKAKELQFYGQKSKRKGDTERYQELEKEYTDTKRSLEGARRRYGTPSTPSVPSTPFEEQLV